MGALIVAEGTNNAVESDLDGNFSLSLPAGTYKIIASYEAYLSDTFNIKLSPNQIITKDFALKASVHDMGTITFVTKVKKDDDMGTLVEKKKETGTSDNIDVKTLQKSATSSVSDGLKKITGASIQDGKFAIIRGMADRYNAGYINGSPLPSTEADKKAFSFDILPTALVDNLTILKSGSADLNGDFGGGIIKISTKSIPDSFIVNVGAGAQYNSVTTGKEYTAFKGSKTDWLGYDDGLRSHPSISTTLGKKNPGSELAAYVEDTKKFNNDYNLQQLKAPFGSRFNLAIGSPFIKKEKFELGGLAAYNYSQTYTRTLMENNFYILDQDANINSKYKDTVGSMTVNNSVIGTLGMKLLKNHKIDYKFMNGINSNVTNVSRFGNNDIVTSALNTIRQYSTIMTYSRMRVHQILGENKFFNDKLKIDWNLSKSNILKEIPDYRVVTYSRFFNEDDGVFVNTMATGYDFKAGNGRFFANLNEELKSGTFNAKYEINKSEKNNIGNSVKFGAFAQERTRKFESQKYVFENLPQANLDPSNPGHDINNDNITANKSFLTNVNTLTDKEYNAKSNLTAYYGMFENNFYERFKISYGVRYEKFNQEVNAFHSNSKLNKEVFLPSINTNLKITPVRSNLRFAAYKTVNRPEFREVASFAFYDFLQNADIIGNPDLKQADINNYEARYEFLPTPEQIVSIGGFYKKINNPIEQRYDISQPTFRTFTFANEKSARVYGVELDFKKNFDFIGHKSDSNFFNFMYFSSNIAITKSVVTVNEGSTSSSGRPLQGQSPYLVNFALGYDNKNNGWAFTFSANKYGRRLATVGATKTAQGVYMKGGYNMYENPRTVVDFQVAKTIKKFTIKGTWGDILHQDLIFYNDVNGDLKFNSSKDQTIYRSKLGYTFTLSVAANL